MITINAVTEDLKTEHDAILTMLEILERIALEFDSKNDVKDEHLDGLVDFFTVFADKCHHGKEEEILFPRLRILDLDLSDRLISDLQDDHKIGKSYILNMLDAIEEYKQTKGGQEKFSQNARAYIELLKAHIEKENSDLFELTNQVLSDQLQVELKDQFDAFEEDVIGDGIHDQLHEMINNLKAHYLN